MDYNFEESKNALKKLRSDLAVVYCDLKEETKTWNMNLAEVRECDEVRLIDMIEILRSDCYNAVETLEKIESL